MQRAYRFRTYPTAPQRQLLAQAFGSARWVWNVCLKWRSHAYQAHGEKVSGIDFSRELTWLKKLEPFNWLANTPSTVYGQTLRDQDKAFANFFAKRGRYPRFKRRESAQSIRFSIDQRRVAAQYKAGELLKLPALGAFQVRWSRLPTGIPKTVTVARDASGRYFVSFSCEEQIAELPTIGKAIGIDLGVKDVLADSMGWKSGNPKHLATKLRALKRYQRRVSRCAKGSNRRKRAVQRVAKCHARVADTRKDWLNKQTTAIIQRADVIAIEDLHVKGMVKNHCLARVISDVGMGELRRQLEYKAAWYGRKVIVIDRWEPTSKGCNECGHLLPELALSVRIWTCPDCGAIHDRDTNAARNILAVATGGRPGRNARGGCKTPSADCSNAVGLLAPNETRTQPECLEASYGQRATKH